jgi:hypothetical protein
MDFPKSIDQLTRVEMRIAESPEAPPTCGFTPDLHLIYT